MRFLPSENIQINYLTLSFPGEVERAFRDSYFSASLRQVRIASALGVFFYAIFGILDAWLVPEVKLALWFIRYAIVCPIVFLVFLFSFTRYFRKYMQLAIASAVLAGGLGIIKMILIAPYPASHSYYAGLILVFFYGYTFYKLRFVWATLTGWIIVIAYEIAAIWSHSTDIPILINNNFFFLTGNVFGMFACYSIEYYLRKNYLQARLLDMEKKKVENVINGIFKARIDSGQLDDSPVTYGDITKIKEAFLSILLGQHHRRIRYPKQDEMEKGVEQKKED